MKLPKELAPPTPEDRARILYARRALKMARSAHAYVRGTTEQFYAWLETATAARLPAGPPIWICGDCHVGNLGPVAAASGDPVIELRDLDQTVIANPAYDLVRLALSLAMAARAADLPGVTTARMIEQLVAGYERSFDGDEPSEKIGDLPRPLRVVMKRALRRTTKELLREGLGTKHARFQLGPRFWPLSLEERDAIAALVRERAVVEVITKLAMRPDDARIDLVDAAYWVKGCSSLGLYRAAVLVELRADKQRSLCLLDIKEASDTFAPHRRRPGMPQDPAERTVTGAREIAPALGERMAAAHLLGRSVFVRELLPQDLKVEIDELSIDDAAGVAYYLGMVVGRAHGRQLDGRRRRAWREELAKQTRELDAPGWLWHAMVELVALHEAGYLEHCRRYALEPALAMRRHG
jgi:uncharacterized protein (DUF2252 family)